MPLIDRYILKLFTGFWLAGVVVFVTMYLVANAMTFALSHGDVDSGTLARYFACQVPWVIYQLMPVCCLMATLFTLSALNKSNELVALFSMGMGLSRVALPIMSLVAFISLVTFVVGDQLLPQLNQKKNYIEYVEIEKHPGLYSTVKTNKIWYRSENVLFNIKTLNPQNKTAQGITLYYFDPAWNLTQLIAADSVAMEGNLWHLKDGLVTLFASESSFPLTKSFQVKDVSMNEDLKDIQSTSNSSDLMSLKELSHFIDRNKEAGLDTLSYEVDYHAKFGFAFAAFVMSMVGVPFSVSRQRSGGTMANVGICIALAFGYWVAYSSGITLGRHGFLPPVVAAWGPNLIAIALAYLALRRLKR